MKAHLYYSGYYIIYQEGDRSLERLPIIHREDLDDKSYIIRDEDTLTSISNLHYGEPIYWYLIADVNEIQNPFVLQVGTSIIIPNIKKYEL